MKKTNYIIILSLIFASIPTLFWERVRELIFKLDVSEAIQVLLIFFIHYLLEVFCMLVITTLIIIVTYRKAPEQKNDALNMLLKFIGSYLSVNVIYWILASLFLFLQVREVIVLPPISFQHTILPCLAISFISSTENLLVFYGVPFSLSALTALCFYLIYRSLLSNEQKHIYISRSFLIRLMLSSGVVGVLDATTNGLLDDNSFLYFGLSIIYVVIFVLTGLLTNSKNRFEKSV